MQIGAAIALHSIPSSPELTKRLFFYCRVPSAFLWYSLPCPNNLLPMKLLLLHIATTVPRSSSSLCSRCFTSVSNNFHSVNSAKEIREMQAGKAGLAI
ncbi:hypothetical protein TIFTF001_052993 [Ficus carica]|uniref:Uncharacterized protein n=1 Tax=Ficus carica TaxID=3494 RepID=A0AA88EEJ0_FICCA|nr:hypothetical protein TIFTF001_052993 [Ficus carica]